MSDVSAPGAIFLTVFFLCLIGSYIIIRRNLIKLRVIGALSAVINCAALVAFGLSNEEIDEPLAITGGIVVGLAFTAAMLTMAAFFQNNQSSTVSAYDATYQQRQSAPKSKSE